MAILPIRFRRATAAVAATNNRVLAAGEPGFETDTGLLKVGDGVSGWKNLPDSNVMLSKGAASSTYAAQGTESTQRLMALLATQSRDASMLLVGDSTGNETTEWFYRLVQALASKYPKWTVTYQLWNDTSGAYDAASTIQTGTGARTLTVYNASVAGATTSFWQAPRFATAVAALSPDLTLVSLGHNEQAIAADLWHGRYVGLTEQVATSLPMSPLLLIAQNPATANTYQQQRREVYREIAAGRGYGFIDVCKAFEDYGTDLTIDGIHPNTTGSQLWADTVLPAFTYQRGVAPRTQPVSPLLQRGDNLLLNGDFSAFTGAAPDNWTLANATAAKDATNYESADINRATGALTSAKAVKFTATGAGQATLIQYLPLNRVKGRWVTIAARIYVPTGQANSVGRLAVSDSTGSTIHVNDTAFQGAFRWVVASRFIPANATYARAYLYIDSGATGTGNLTVDRVTAVVGKYPMAGADSGGGAGTAGATGPVGPSPSFVEFMSTLGNSPANAIAGVTSNTLAGANQGLAVKVRPHRNLSLTSLRWFTGTVTSGNYDIGIYDAAGNRLWSKGSTPWPAVSVGITETVSPAVALTAGTDYLIVFTGDNITGAWRGLSEALSDQTLLLDGSQWCRSVSSVFPLPATITPGSTRAGRIPLAILGGV